MAGSGLGTPATRAAIIETLLRREYVVRSGKQMQATDKGIVLIESVHGEVKSPEMTAQWEQQLQALEHGRGSLDGFMADIETYVRSMTQRTSARVSPQSARAAARPTSPTPAVAATSPRHGHARTSSARRAPAHEGASADQNPARAVWVRDIS